MSFRSALLAAAALSSFANSHIIMDSPVPYSVDKIDNSPITAAQFPCKSQNGFTVSQETEMAVETQQNIGFKGSAVHNGGLCQLSVALTQEPKADTTFKVIKTIEGGCPGLDSATKNFTYELPKDIPTGKATFAWTWMPVSSGQAEYYMNCAPISVTGGASDDSGFNKLPDMLVANLEGLTTCKQVANTILKAPNPGSVVETGDTSKPLQAPTGDCGTTGDTPPTEGGSSSAAQGSATAAPIASSAPVASSAPNDGQYTQPAASQAPAGTSAAAVPSNPGGVFAPSASSGAGAAQSTTTTLVTVTGSPSAQVPVGTGSPAQPSGSTPPTTGGSACSNNGAVVCNGETQFGLCNNGQVTWQAVAAGTTCKDGVISKRGYNGRIARPRRAMVPGKYTPSN